MVEGGIYTRYTTHHGREACMRRDLSQSLGRKEASLCYFLIIPVIPGFIKNVRKTRRNTGVWREKRRNGEKRWETGEKRGENSRLNPTRKWENPGKTGRLCASSLSSGVKFRSVREVFLRLKFIPGKRGREDSAQHCGN